MHDGQEPLGEFDLIDRYFAPAPPGVKRRTDVILGIGDDAALLRCPEKSDLVAAVDTLVAGRHFPAGSAPRSIGHRSLAVNLSDLAAMGATPAWATLALTLPSADGRWLEAFSAGFMELAAAHGVELVGGDTTSGPLTISVQILGQVDRGSALRRSGAQPGDILAVTGTLGDAGAGLALVTGRATAEDRVAGVLIERFEYPTPRVQFGSDARGIASAAMDLSDGLVGDLPKLARASGLAAHVDVERLPLSGALRSLATVSQGREWALAAGDDYELLVAVPPRRFDELAAVAARLNLTFTAIGELRRGTGVTWALEGLSFAAPARGYEHFR
ncbi:MAG: thiamine-monophosphate kinase [Gammaproteobacteria bacterium]|nr:thiamine-monophosphate kinase [Gammaproteobacteria bacterium]